MRIKVYVIELSPAAKRMLVLAIAGTIVCATTLRADANVPNTFSAGDLLSAQKLNANFADIDSWRGHPVVTVGGSQFSVGAAYCGLSAPTTGQVTSGMKQSYAAAKALCETTCASPSAHMCTSEEIVRSMSAGVVEPATKSSWYSAGFAPSGSNTYDCSMWTGTTAFGPLWAYGTTIELGGCSSAYPLACCD
jgi:hypothetical protein